MSILYKLIHAVKLSANFYIERGLAKELGLASRLFRDAKNSTVLKKRIR